MDNDALFRAIADPTRRLILDEMAQQQEQTLYELISRLVMKHKVSMSRQAIAKHIAVLEEAGLVESKRQGKYRVLIFNSAPIKTITERWLK